MRHVIVHDYFGIDLDLVWRAVERELPALKEAAERALAFFETKQ